MNAEQAQVLCDIIDTQNKLIRQLLELLGQYQAVDEYEKEIERQQQEYAALTEGR